MSSTESDQGTTASNCGPQERAIFAAIRRAAYTHVFLRVVGLYFERGLRDGKVYRAHRQPLHDACQHELGFNMYARLIDRGLNRKQAMHLLGEHELKMNRGVFHMSREITAAARSLTCGMKKLCSFVRPGAGRERMSSDIQIAQPR